MIAVDLVWWQYVIIIAVVWLLGAYLTRFVLRLFGISQAVRQADERQLFCALWPLAVFIVGPVVGVSWLVCQLWKPVMPLWRWFYGLPERTADRLLNWWTTTNGPNGPKARKKKAEAERKELSELPAGWGGWRED